MPENEIDLRAIFNLLRRQLRLIIVTVLVIVTLAGVATFSLKPMYTATALVMVDPSRKDLLDPTTMLASGGSDSARVESEVELVRSDNVLMKVIQDLKLVNDPEFGVSLGLRSWILSALRLDDGTLPSGDEALSMVLNKVRAAVSVQRRGLTYLIALQARSGDPAKAATLANAITSAYIADQVASKINSTLASRDILQSRIEQARQAIVTSEGSFDKFISDNVERIVADSGDTRIADLRTQMQAIQAARDKNVKTADLARQSLLEENWGGLASTLASDAVRALEQQRRQVAGQLQQVGDANSQQAIDLKAALNDLDSQLKQSAQTELEALQSSISASQSTEDEVRQKLRDTVISSQLPAGVLTQIYELQQNATIARTQYDTLLTRAQELGAQADLQVADSRVVSPALTPASPSFPNTQLILLLSAICALGVAVALAFLYENFIGGFVSEDQVEAVLKGKVVTTIPRQRNLKPGQLSFSELVVSAPISMFAESIRRMRAAIDQSAGRNGLANSIVIMVTSTTPGEGKTTASVALARSYALAGKTTLLVDCDLRKPGVGNQLGIESSEALIAFLNQKKEAPSVLSEFLETDPMTDAVVISGARRSNVATDQLIAGANFDKLIAAARSIFDVVILDTPPIGPVVDGLYVAANADMIVYLIKYGTTPQTDARKALARLSAAKPSSTEVFFAISQQDVSRRTYLGQYGDYYIEED